MKNQIYKREKYLSRIRPFYKSDVIKIITGIRRCGKSCILKLIYQELLKRENFGSVEENNIIFLPLDQRGYKYIKTPEQLESKIEELLTIKNLSNKKINNCYLFIDEVQNVKGFESVVHAYQEEGMSIFLTGSNSYLLSDEISTKLTGRYVSFEIFPLDFEEYVSMKNFYGLDINEDIYKEFEQYVLYGGFPQILEFSDNSAKQHYTREVVNSIFVKDVKSRNRILNLAVFERVQDFLINNFTAPFSLKSLMSCLHSEGFAVKDRTVRTYIEDLVKAKILYECNRFDLKSKRALKREQKYYLADMSIYFSQNVDNRISYGPTLENIVYLFLVSNDYQVSIGKIGNFECDFIARDKNRNYLYIQVTYSLHGSDSENTKKIIEREYRPFRKINDSFPRYIVSLDRYCDQHEGVKHINAIDLFLGKERLSL